MLSTPRALTLFAVVVAALPATTFATNGPAFTGITASANDAVTAATNPAGLTRLHRPEWVGELKALYLDSKFKTTGESIGASSTDDSSSSLYIPGVFYARPLNDDIALGVSLTVPSGLGSNPGDDTPGRYLLEKWSLGYVSLAPAAGYRVNERFSIGAAINFNYAIYDYETAVFNGPNQPDGKMKLNAGDFGMGFQLGSLFELSPHTRFGLTYRSSSTSKFSDTPELSGLTPERENLLGIGIRSKSISLESKFPQAVTAGAYHEFADGKTATLDVAWVDFSQYGLTSATVGETSIELRDKHYENIWAASVGMSWPINAKWTGRVGAAYVSSGVDDQNRGFAFRLDRIIGAGVGAEYQWGQDRVVGLNLAYFDLGKGKVEEQIPLVGTLSGEYSSNYAIGLDFTLRWLR